MIKRLISFGQVIAARLDALADAGLSGLLFRLAFAAVLLVYFLNSASLKLGEGVFGFLFLSPSAYYQIAPQAVEAAGGDIDSIALLPWGLIVHFGTWAEILLPLLIVAGLFTRLAALGMIGFVLVQSLVDITVHKVEASTIGALFDHLSDSVILDQRTLWIALLLGLLLKGGGMLSLDRLLVRRT